jgi:AraC-like DNA-binding protein
MLHDAWVAFCWNWEADRTSGTKETDLVKRAAVMDAKGPRRFGALPSASGTITRLAYAQLQAEECDALLLLEKARLNIAQINDPASRLNVRDQIQFLDLAADTIRDDLLGFHLAQQVDLREMGLLYYVMSSSESLREALQRCARFSSIVNEGVSLKYNDSKDLRITFDYVGVSRHLDRHQMEFIATVLVRIGQLLTGSRLVPIRTTFAHRRDRVSLELFEFFGREVEFGADADEATFAASTADRPVLGADPHLNKLLEKYCIEALARRPISLGAFRPAVENAIVPLLPHGKARVAEIARRLGLTKRTLARRLSLEGVTFSEVSEKLKCDLARRYLAEESLSISRIAWLLGYQEIGAFTHAFKRWTGKSPREMRSLLAKR